MAKNKVPNVLISYSSEDAVSARKIVDAILDDNRVSFIDHGRSKIGNASYKKFVKGALKDADYYLIVISENSANSPWVSHQIAVAFELAEERNLPIIPFLINQVDVPWEFKGLVNIDGTESFEEGLNQLRRFFERQTKKVRELADIPRREQKQFQQADRYPEGLACPDILGALELGDLRFELSAKLTLKDIRVLWFDVFSTKMEDDVFSQDRATCCLELLDRSSREERLPKVIDKVCRNYPRITEGL
jgi:hypothetical protein